MALLKKVQQTEIECNRVSQQIDYHLQLSAEKERRTIRILLVGSSDSGKAYLMKQWKNFDNFGISQHYSDEEIHSMTARIQHEVIGYMKVLCVQSIALSEEQKTQVQEDNRVYLQEVVNLPSPSVFNQELAQKLLTLWADPGIQETWRLRAKYRIARNMEYMLGRLEQICAANYKPDPEDMDRMQNLMTETITVDVDRFGKHYFEFMHMEVGGKPLEKSRRRLRMIAGQMHALLYVVNISAYDLGDAPEGVLTAVRCFGTLLVRMAALKDKSVLICFHNYDLFRCKIKTTPMTIAFPDFPVDEMDPHDVDDAVRFLAGKFLQCFEEHNIAHAGPLHITRTSSVDWDSLDKVFRDITLDLCKTQLRSYGIKV